MPTSTGGPACGVHWGPPELVVVGLGASAGGLVALLELVTVFPEKSGLTLIVVQHFEPSAKSLLPELLQSKTHIPVTELADGETLERDRAYVCPPWAQIDFEDTKVKLSRLGGVHQRCRRIDHFFEALATTFGAASAAAVLSGGGSDGSLGIFAIERVGGLTLAQDPATASYPWMPSNAIDTGYVRHVLPVAQMPAVIVTHFADILGAQTGARPVPHDHASTGATRVNTEHGT